MRSVLRAGLAHIGRLVRAHPLAFATAVTGATLFVSAIVAASIVIGRITDNLIIPVLDGGESYEGRVAAYAAAIAGIALWKAIGITIRRTGAGWLQGRTQADLRSRLLAHQYRLELAWHNRQSTGDLLALSDSDASTATFVLGPLPYGIGTTILLAGSLVLIWVTDWPIGLVTTVALATAIAIDLRASWRTFDAFRGVQDDRAYVATVAHESFDGALTVKALGREDMETARFESASNRLRDDLAHVGKIAETWRVVVDALPAMAVILVLIVGAARIRAGLLTPGELVTVTYLLSLLAFPIRLIGFVVWDISHSLAAWRRVERVLDADEIVTHGGLEPSLAPTGASVDGVQVGFGYAPDEPVLEGLTLDVEPGETIAIVGPTGAGKSTLAHLIARLWDPDLGAITLDGRDVRDLRAGGVASEVTLVSQQPFLFDTSVLDNITLGEEFSRDSVAVAAKLAKAHGFITKLPDGYDTRLGERGTSLSGGQRQRIALARALVRKPRVLILDDATSAVDPTVETEIIMGLRSADLPSTVIIVAYRRSSILLADRVVFIDSGRVIAEGTHEELLAGEPGYARILTAYSTGGAL